MCWVQYQKDGVLKNSSPGSYGDPPLPSGNRISPEVVFIIVILALLFLVSGLLHLLLRFLVKNPSNSPQNPEISDALQRQLQQLFNQHEYDTGLDRAFIDALPVFMYREIVGSKEPLDCAVCLSEFLETHKLRLLPICGHAFHINCIDTWLLSNSTCPLCRAALFNPGFSPVNPMFDYAEEDGDNGISADQKPIDLQEEIVVPVRLGKFCKLNNVAGEGESSSSNLDSRRCYSMGSYRYVVGDTNLRVALPLNRQRNGDNIKVVKSRDQEPCCWLEEADGEGKRLSTDSYSVSKIWLWSKKGKFASSSNNSLLENPPAIDVDLPWMKRRVGQ